VSDWTPSPAPSEADDTFADQLVRRLAPWLTPDLETYLRAIASMWDEVALYAFDYDTADERFEGWTILFDPDRCPAPALPHLAQYRGENLPIGLSEAAQREWIKDAPNQTRGTPRAVFEAAQRRLTGGRLVSMLERAGGVVDKVQIVTYTSQTPDPTSTQADILSVLPADVILEYLVQAGQNWTQVKATYATWNAAKVKTWTQVLSTLSGYSQYPGSTP
jgi:hypothetical protein